MAYIGRALVQGNYVKLDDLQSQFDGSKTTFTLATGGKSFKPGTANALLVSLGGVIQEAVTSFTVVNDQITFSNPPTADAQIFIIALGASVSIPTPADGTVPAGKFIKETAGISTNTSVGVNTSTVDDNDLTGIGNSFKGLYVANGMVITDKELTGVHYIGTNFSSVMAGPVTIGGTITVDGNYVVV